MRESHMRTDNMSAEHGLFNIRSQNVVSLLVCPTACVRVIHNTRFAVRVYVHNHR